MNSSANIDFNDEDFKFENDFPKNVGQIAKREETNRQKSSKKEITSQELIDKDFPDIARLNIVNVSGDDKTGKVVIILYACRIPPVHEINLDHLWEYIVKTMARFVSNDYSLLYFHYGLNNNNNPGIRFLLRVYRQIDRDYKKNLKNLFIVHPTTMLKVIISALLPFFSQKVKSKIIKVERLKDLETYFYLDQMIIPDLVRKHDHRIDVQSSLGSRPKFVSNQLYYSKTDGKSSQKAQFGVALQQVQEVYPEHSLPPVMEQCIVYLRKECLDCEGIFRRSSSKILLDEVQQKFNSNELVDFAKYQNPHLAACIFKTFLRSLKEPLMTFDLYEEVIKIHDMTCDEAVYHIKKVITTSLPQYNYDVLKNLIEFLREVADHSHNNLMTVQNLANIFAPNLCWSRNESAINAIHDIITFTVILLENADDIFVKKDSA